MIPAAAVPHWREYRRVWTFLRPYRWQLALVILISLAATALNLIQPFLSRSLIDRALLKSDMRALVTLSSAMFIATIIGFVLNILASYRYISLSAAMLFDMRLALFRHLQALSPRFYAQFRLGDLMSRLNNDIGEVQRVSADTMLSVLSNVMFLVGSVVMMLLLNWKLFFLSTVLIPLCIYTFMRFQRKLIALTKLLRERSADLGSLFVDSILGMRVVISLSAADHEAHRFRERNDAFVRTMLDVQISSFMTGALPGTILTAATSAVFVYGGWLIFHHALTIGTLVAFMAYYARLMSPIQNLMGVTSGLALARVSLGRIFELFDAAPDVTEAADALPLSSIRESIRIENVSMRYDRELVLRDISLDIPAGTFCAIVGASGAGKSTLADLLVRYLDPDGGRVLVDGQDIRQIKIDHLRRAVMLVDQSPYLFNASIAENISYAWPSASRAEIERVSEAAGLGELIARLPQRYETKTGERGLALSAGERQRIALARAFLRCPDVLILDEPTSALDEDNEKLIASNLRNILPNCTLIVITHRPALAANADMVIHIREGKAVTVDNQRTLPISA